MVNILLWTPKSTENTFQAMTFKVEENLNTFEGLVKTFKDFSRLCEPCNTWITKAALFVCVLCLTLQTFSQCPLTSCYKGYAIFFLWGAGGGGRGKLGALWEMCKWPMLGECTITGENLTGIYKLRYHEARLASKGITCGSSSRKDLLTTTDSNCLNSSKLRRDAEDWEESINFNRFVRQVLPSLSKIKIKIGKINRMG